MKPLQIGNITVPFPIVQGGMGIGISMSRLASAVANAGGIGTIATVGLGLVYDSPDKTFRENNAEAVKNEIRKARKLTSGILAVNIMTVLTNFSDLVETAIAEKIDIIFSGAGLPLDLPKYLKKSSKTKLVPIVSSGRAAKIIAQKWKNNFDYLPDAFVVEGPKAGGHLGFNVDELTENTVQLEDIVKDTLEVADDIRREYQKEVPVIAGGGIMTGEDIYDILEMGVSGVQIGSRFVATEECDASEDFKNAIISATADDIRIIKSPVGLPGRALNNKFLRSSETGEVRPDKCKFNCIRSCNPKTTSFCIADALLASYLGKLEEGFVFTGAEGHRITEMTTVPELFAELVNGYEEAVEKKKSNCMTS